MEKDHKAENVLFGTETNTITRQAIIERTLKAINQLRVVLLDTPDDNLIAGNNRIKLQAKMIIAPVLPLRRTDANIGL